VVELLSEKKRGKRSILVRSETGIEREHLVTHSKHLRVHAGDKVRAGESLVDGPLVPHDILRISGEEAVQQYLTREIQNVYRSQRVEINDKHIEIIVSQMLGKVRVESPGDTDLLPGSVIDKLDFRVANEALTKCLRIAHKGDSDFNEGAVVPKDVLEQTNAQIEALGGDITKGARPKMATASTQLLGITKASVQSSSFISAASFQETTKVLTEAALAGRTDYLVGLKENVILGHLIPAGTGFHTIQAAEVRIQPAALEALAAEKERVLERSFPLLDSALQSASSQSANNGDSGGTGVVGSLATSSEVPSGPSGLDALLGSGGEQEPSAAPEVTSPAPSVPEALPSVPEALSPVPEALSPAPEALSSAPETLSPAPSAPEALPPAPEATPPAGEPENSWSDEEEPKDL